MSKRLLTYQKFNEAVEITFLEAFQHMLENYRSMIIVTNNKSSYFETEALKHNYLFFKSPIYLNTSVDLIKEIDRNPILIMSTESELKSISLPLRDRCATLRYNNNIESEKLLKTSAKTGLYESLVNVAKDKEIFNYRSFINDQWRPLIKQAQEFQKINFDLENNESSKEKKTLYITKNLRKDQPVKYQFNLELWNAGGDWECMVSYFKVQVESQYGIIQSKYYKEPKYIFDFEKKPGGLSKCYVIIPDNETGGNHYTKSKKGYTAYTDESLKAEGLKNWKDVKNDPAKSWKWIEKYLTDIVDERHEMLDEPSNSEPSDPSADSNESRKSESMSEITITSTNEKIDSPGLNAQVTFASPNGPTHLKFTKYNNGAEQFNVCISSNKCTSSIDNVPKKYRKDFEMLRAYLKEKKPYLWSEKLSDFNTKTGILD